MPNKKIFGANTLNYEDYLQISSFSSELIRYALPLLGIFTLLEWWVSWRGENNAYHAKETRGSVLVGIGNLLVNILLKSVLVIMLVAIYNLIPWRLEPQWWTAVICLLAYDCSSYWAHRISHSNRFFWATHVVHHSAEHYNLTVSFRLSWVQHFKLIFFMPILCMGFHPFIFLLVHQLAVLFQFWQHTERIGRLHRFVEYFVVTPSHHRVHHGSNEKYIDKNFGVILIIWDRWFGTFQREEEKPVYGITEKSRKKADPFYLNFNEYTQIIKDCRLAKTWKEKLYYLFGNPGKIARHKKKMSALAEQKSNTH